MNMNHFGKDYIMITCGDFVSNNIQRQKSITNLIDLLINFQ